MVATAVNFPTATLDRCVIHDREADEQPVLLVISPRLYAEWYRRDDTIDYVEAHSRDSDEGPDLDPVVTPVPAGIYPYAGDYMDSRTGQQLAPSRAHHFRRLARDGHTPDILDTAARAIRPLTRHGNRLIFSDAAEATQHIAPIVPDDVKALMKFGELFTDPDGWMELRPVHYKWWR